MSATHHKEITFRVSAHSPPVVQFVSLIIRASEAFNLTKEQRLAALEFATKCIAGEAA